ncbi:glycoside hydrolase family 13 protein [Nonomuraea sp. 3N208]|uniref:glycoside hydrolase family 13 protein n=1 Tax=Nonomuraea sp. 3N208 TaxID=3457421 RepID=UPI003FD4DD80
MSWWRGAAIYQVYLRSFADGSGDGVGDLAGLRARLPYLRELGVDALWLTPWYVSPMADAGYDVADYRDIDPLFGTLAEADALISEAHDHRLRVIVDIVPNHTSDRHPWFRAALTGGPGSPERERYHFRDAPNDWPSRFGGPAWTRVPDGEWYLHLFDSSQPDLNWEHPDVRAEFESILRFWLDRGVDGFRIDVADRLVKADGLPDLGPDPDPMDQPHADRPEVHEIYRSWRKLLDSYPGERMFVGEIWVSDPARFARYLRPDELHTAFNFPFLRSPWEAGRLRAVIDSTLAAHAPAGAPPTWVLSNHDVTRHVTRYGRSDTGYTQRTRDEPADLALGTRRGRAAALLTMALPGGVYLYQGDELGLWEVLDIPAELRQDPVTRRTNGAELGRDGCRVPIPWEGAHPPFGFGPARTWLPQPPEWRPLTVAAQERDPDSMLSLYRTALRIRGDEPALGDGTMTWLPAGPDVLAFTRDPGFACVVNLSRAPIELPAHTRVLLLSGDLAHGLLPPDTAAWLQQGEP